MFVAAAALARSSSSHSSSAASKSPRDENHAIRSARVRARARRRAPSGTPTGTRGAAATPIPPHAIGCRRAARRLADAEAELGRVDSGAERGVPVHTQRPATFHRARRAAAHDAHLGPKRGRDPPVRRRRFFFRRRRRARRVRRLQERQDRQLVLAVRVRCPRRRIPSGTVPAPPRGAPRSLGAETPRSPKRSRPSPRAVSRRRPRPAAAPTAPRGGGAHPRPLDERHRRLRRDVVYLDASVVRPRHARPRPRHRAHVGPSPKCSRISFSFISNRRTVSEVALKVALVARARDAAFCSDAKVRTTSRPSASPTTTAPPRRVRLARVQRDGQGGAVVLAGEDDGDAGIRVSGLCRRVAGRRAPTEPRDRDRAVSGAARDVLARVRRTPRPSPARRALLLARGREASAGKSGAARAYRNRPRARETCTRPAFVPSAPEPRAPRSTTRRPRLCAPRESAPRRPRTPRELVRQRAENASGASTGGDEPAPDDAGGALVLRVFRGRMSSLNHRVPRRLSPSPGARGHHGVHLATLCRPRRAARAARGPARARTAPSRPATRRLIKQTRFRARADRSPRRAARRARAGSGWDAPGGRGGGSRARETAERAAASSTEATERSPSGRRRPSLRARPRSRASGVWRHVAPRARPPASSGGSSDVPAVRGRRAESAHCARWTRRARTRRASGARRARRADWAATRTRQRRRTRRVSPSIPAMLDAARSTWHVSGGTTAKGRRAVEARPLVKDARARARATCGASLAPERRAEGARPRRAASAASGGGARRGSRRRERRGRVRLGANTNDRTMPAWTREGTTCYPRRPRRRSERGARSRRRTRLAARSRRSARRATPRRRRPRSRRHWRPRADGGGDDVSAASSASLLRSIGNRAAPISL